MNDTEITVEELAQIGETLLGRAGVPTINFQTPFDEALHLTRHALGYPAEVEGRVSLAQTARALDLFERRITTRVPSAYLTEEAPFGAHRFYVKSSVMAPRPSMSPFLASVVDTVVWSNERALDLGTGSGCIGITLALMRPSLHVDLADISPEALEVARVNVDKFQLSDRVRCFESDLFSGVTKPYSLVVSNPPYLSSYRYERYSAEEVRKEPRIAFDGGGDGLELVAKIIEQAPNHLAPGGTLMMDVGRLGEHLLPKRFPHLRFKWLSHEVGGTPGIFTLSPV